ncbi:hypothetical protein ['Camptotheca acuminata' phytoplasma]|uniref:hypothetical protein n=1 Tax='Camptotheca acuminata' phytoplasma TaxID=3239192 RepID=UPI003519F242
MENWDSPIIKAAVYCIVVILITTLLSLFVFDVVEISVPLCLISFGCLLGCVFAFFG